MDEALGRFRSSDADDAWSLRVLRGDILNSSASCGETTAYLHTLRLPTRLARTKIGVDRSLALATAQAHCNDVHGAADSFAAASAAASHDSQLSATVLVRKADFEINTHAWTAAERDLRLALQKSQQPRTTARAWGALGKLRGQQERYDEAIEANGKALAIATENSDTALALFSRTNLGWLYVASGDYDRAVDVLSAVDAENARLGRKNERVVALMQLGNAYLDRQQYSPAANYYRQALAIAEELNSPARDTLLENLARAAFGAQDFDTARRLNDQAQQVRQARGDVEALQRTRVTSARILEKLGRGAEAETIYQGVVAGAKSRTARLEALVFLAEYHANNRQRASAEKEFRRALALSEEARGELKSDELRLAFTTTLDALVNDFIEFLIVDGRPTDALRVAESSRARALSDGLGLPRTEQTRVEFRAAARERGTILSYWLTPKISFLWVITPDSISALKLAPEGEINAAIDAYQADLAGPRGTLEMSAAHGARLWSMLVEPAGGVRGQNVMIVADKHLNALNFETLVISTPRPHYWIEDVTIVTASSVQLLAKAGGPPAAQSMLLVGNPLQADPALPALSWAADEVQRVGAHFRDRTLLDGVRATPRAYAAAASPRYGYVHFVAHGVSGGNHALDSAIVLGRDANGYKLYARDILRHRIGAKLVTISSCHGAGQRAYAGEGLVGLAWAFLRAGAHQVIAALWEVSDSATPQLMDAMYAGIERGETPAAALRAAKLNLLRSKSVYRRPLYWAPFVLYSGA